MEIEETSENAAWLFWVVLLVAVFFCILLELSSKVYPMPHWRDNIMQTKQVVENRKKKLDYSSKVLVENLEGALSRFNGRVGVCLRPSVVVDSWKVLLEKQPVLAHGGKVQPEEEARIPFDNLKLLQPDSPRKRGRGRLEKINVTDVEAKQSELFNLIDINKNNHLDLREIGTVIGFVPPDIPEVEESSSSNRGRAVNSIRAVNLANGAGEEEEEVEIHSPDYRQQASGLSATRALQAPLNLKMLQENSSKARTLLKENSIMQEAVLLLLEHLFCNDEAFVRLKLKNSVEAANRLASLKMRAMKAFDDINRGVSWSVEKSPARGKSWCFKDNCQYTLGRKLTEINYQGWQKIMSTIFQRKFF